ncbi:GNAT family N-acetyltransferase [Alkalihalobacillus sp. AL-G]|uniref:GNAT family N-acetyltransferase n=1 Tax=Alkalihalobacillus sp. AL-G TaxID=2926399 RepID=UPI00272C9250|nr:GNAT family N-acetyltransferase [Alkalihalobacillus sp. AL-G]WLD94355.1 GNAT family N-acetyltransferase [Alkalihalobacillus sp. AL-G]
MTIKLIKPTIELREEYLKFYQEWVDSGESIVPWTVKEDPSDFEKLVQFLIDSEKAVNSPEGWVPHSNYWLVDEKRNILGAVNIRHGLTKKLLTIGGHIGYGVRPSERRKGYATKILEQALKKTAELGIEKVLVTCNKDNVASERTILKNGGILEDEFIEDDGTIVRRYWIELC